MALPLLFPFALPFVVSTQSQSEVKAVQSVGGPGRSVIGDGKCFPCSLGFPIQETDEAWSFIVRFILLYFTIEPPTFTTSYFCWLCKLFKEREGNWVLFWSALLIERLSLPNLNITLSSYVHLQSSRGDNQGSNHIIWLGIFYCWILLMTEQNQVCYP